MSVAQKIERRPRVLIADPIAAEGVKLLTSQVQADVHLKLTPGELLAVIGEYEGLVVRSETRVTAEVIAAGKRLQVIGRAGVGVDNVDVQAATSRGIVVVNAPTGNTISAAEHTIAMMLALCRHIPQAHSLLKGGVWERSKFTGVEVKNKVLGVIGLGNVGAAVARRALGLEMKVIGYDPFVSSDYAQRLQVRTVTLDELFRESDFITVHVPLLAQTRSIIGERELAKVKPSVRIINVARGGLVNEQALYQALEEGRVAGAAIDVFEEEPASNNILLKSDKVVVTPHLGASTVEAQTGVAVDTAEQVVAVLEGRPARYAVNAPLIPTDLYPVLGPYVSVATAVGRLASQLAVGQMESIHIQYDGEIGNYHTAALKAAVLGGLLEMVSEERVNLVNANMVAQRRGLNIVEHKGGTSEAYTSLLTVRVTTSSGTTIVAGTVMRGGTHIVRVNDYWIDVAPTGGYFLFADHKDRPGLIGAVGNITGKADINIHSMQLGRLGPRGNALLVLGLDEPLTDALRQQVLALPDVHTAKLVKL
ncbi:MAG: phosphoglycerate dehydrogenase [Chloroflexi bacterium]|nr:phosphoglycerate dehydrogenase [Chloroflexota bacterium]